MTTYVANAPAFRLSEVLEGMTGEIAAFGDSYRRARKAANMYTALSALSDEQLAARGMERQDITEIVRMTLYG